MAAPADEARRNESVPRLVSELWELVVAYLKQETVQPLRGLGGFVAFGFPGAILSAAGLAVLLLAALRVLQTETGTTFSGDRTALPYVITAAAGVAVVGLAGLAIVSGRSRKGRR